MVIVAEVSKVLTPICRSCVCQRLKKARDLIFLFEFPPGLPGIQVIHTGISRLTQVCWARARASTSVRDTANEKLPSPMASQLTASQRSTGKRSSRR